MSVFFIAGCCFFYKYVDGNNNYNRNNINVKLTINIARKINMKNKKPVNSKYFICYCFLKVQIMENQRYIEILDLSYKDVINIQAHTISSAADGIETISAGRAKRFFRDELEYLSDEDELLEWYRSTKLDDPVDIAIRDDLLDFIEVTDKDDRDTKEVDYERSDPFMLVLRLEDEYLCVGICTKWYDYNKDEEDEEDDENQD